MKIFKTKQPQVVESKVKNGKPIVLKDFGLVLDERFKGYGFEIIKIWWAFPLALIIFLAVLIPMFHFWFHIHYIYAIVIACLVPISLFMALLMKYPIKFSDKALLKKNADLENSRFQTPYEITQEDDTKTFYLSDLNRDDHDIKSGILISAHKVESGDDILISITRPNGHAMIIGTTGSGKTTGFIQPNVEILSRCVDKPSLIIPDPKGELYQYHSESLKKQGYRIVKIDFQDLYSSIRWNVFDFTIRLTDEYKALEERKNEITFNEETQKYVFERKEYDTYEQAYEQIEVLRDKLRDEIQQDLGDVVESLFDISEVQGESKQWLEKAQSAIFALVYGMWEDLRDGIITNEQFIVSNVIYNINKYFVIETHPRTGETSLPKPFLDYLEKREAKEPNNPMLSKIASLRNSQKSERTFSSYLTSVGELTEYFADQGILALTSEMELDFATFDDTPTAFFMKIDVTKTQRHRFVSLVISQLYKTLNKKAYDNYISGEMNDIKLKRPIYFLLDEFANLPKIPRIETIVSYGRSIGLVLETVVQDYKQLSLKYDKSGDIIKSQANVKIFIGTNDQNTLDEISKACGNMKYVERGVSDSKQESGGSVSRSVRTKPLISPSELNALNSDKNNPEKWGNVIALRLNKNPSKLKVTPIYQAFDIYGVKPVDTLTDSARKFDAQKLLYDIKSSLETVKEEKPSRPDYKTRRPRFKEEIENYEMPSFVSGESEDTLNYENTEEGAIFDFETEKITKEIETEIASRNSSVINKELSREATNFMSYIADIEEELKRYLSNDNYEKYARCETFEKKLKVLTDMIADVKSSAKKNKLTEFQIALNNQLEVLQDLESRGDATPLFT